MPEFLMKGKKLTKKSRTLPALVVMMVTVLFLQSCTTDGGISEGDIVAKSDGAISLPKVEGVFGENPVVTIPNEEPPSSLQSIDITAGTGESVVSTSELTVNYHLVTWSDKAIIESSFTSAPATFPLSGVILGWQEGLVGARAGGRRLLVIPPDLGYGATAQGPIAANETLVFVVDILEVN